MFFQELNCAFLSDRTNYSSIQFGLRRRSKITVKFGQKIRCSSVDHCLIPMKRDFFRYLMTLDRWVQPLRPNWRSRYVNDHRAKDIVFFGRGDFRVYWLIEFVLIKTLPFHDPNCLLFFFAVGTICFFWRWSHPNLESGLKESWDISWFCVEV